MSLRLRRYALAPIFFWRVFFCWRNFACPASAATKVEGGPFGHGHRWHAQGRREARARTHANARDFGYYRSPHLSPPRVHARVISLASAHSSRTLLSSFSSAAFAHLHCAGAPVTHGRPMECLSGRVHSPSSHPPRHAPLTRRHLSLAPLCAPRQTGRARGYSTARALYFFTSFSHSWQTSCR